MKIWTSRKEDYMNQISKTITTVEIAEMMETEHSKIIRKLDGREEKGKHIKGYIEILSEAQMGVAKYFIESSYIDAQGKPRKCYDVSKIGCDFLANKFTGEKGILFTAKYVERFEEMENRINQLPLTEHPGEVANLLKVLSSIMSKQGTVPYKIAENAKVICEQYGITLVADFVNIPEFEQMQLTLIK